MPVKMRIRVDTGYLLTWDKKAAKQTYRRAAAEILAAARQKIRKGGGTGRRYYLDGGGRYVASAPGQAPVSLTGALRRSGKASAFKSGTGFVVRFGAFYSVMLEGGARGGAGSRLGKAGSVRNRRGVAAGSRVLEPRPFLTAALDERAQSIEARIKDAIMSGIEFRRSKEPRK